MIKFDDILKVSERELINTNAVNVKKFAGISIDSRKIKSSECFFAIKGENTDGHKFLLNIFKKGVRLAVVDRKWYNKNKSKFGKNSFIVVEDTVKALGELARIHKRNFNIEIMFVGGSNGKTTTKDLIGAVLSNKFNLLLTEGNFNNHIGLPLTLLKMNNSHEFCVLEAGSNHFKELEYLCGIAEPDCGLITNIGKEHLEFFGNIHGVAKEEFEIYDYLVKNNKVCFANYDDNFIKEYFRKNKNTDKFTYSYKFNTNVKGKFKKFTKEFYPEINITHRKINFSSKIAAFGLHSVQNGLAAAAVGLYFGVKPAAIKSSLANFRHSCSKRMQVLESRGIKMINDTYNSNPDSASLGLKSVSEFKIKGNKHIVLGDMLEMGKSSENEHFGIGVLAEKLKVRNLYTYGKYSYNTFKGAGKIKNNYYFEQKEDLIGFLKAVVTKGDLIYVKGSRGMKMEEVVNAFN